MNNELELKDPRWEKKRLKIFERDNWMCRNCGSEEKPLCIHSQIDFSTPIWDTDDEYLKTFCEKCFEYEKEALEVACNRIVYELREGGFSSFTIEKLADIFKKDRDWSGDFPALEIIEMVVNDDILWNKMFNLYFRRLKEKNGNVNYFDNETDDNAPIQ